MGQSPRASISYSPYGHRSTESGLTSLLGFNGERQDATTGRYLLGNGHRAFNPASMRFDKPDVLSPFGKGGLNPYAYCLGDPVNSVDPTGQFSFSWMRSALPNFIVDQRSVMTSSPWFSWSSRQVEIAKHINRGTPFANSPFQEAEVFVPNISTKPFSLKSVSPSPPSLEPRHVSTVRELAADKFDGKSNWFALPQAQQRVIADTYRSEKLLKRFSSVRANPDNFEFESTFAAASGSKNFSSHTRKFRGALDEINNIAHYAEARKVSFTPMMARHIRRAL